MVEGVDDKVHAVGDEGHDDAQDAQEHPVLNLAEALAPQQRQELCCTPVTLEEWSKWILHSDFWINAALIVTQLSAAQQHIFCFMIIKQNNLTSRSNPVGPYPSL